MQLSFTWLAFPAKQAKSWYSVEIKPKSGINPVLKAIRLFPVEALSSVCNSLRALGVIVTGGHITLHLVLACWNPVWISHRHPKLNMPQNGLSIFLAELSFQWVRWLSMWSAGWHSPHTPASWGRQSLWRQVFSYRTSGTASDIIDINLMLNEWNTWCCGDDRFEISESGGVSPSSSINTGEKQQSFTEETVLVPLSNILISFELESSPFGFNLLGVWCIPKNNRHTQFKIQIKAYIILAHLYHCLVDTVLIWLNQTKNVLLNLKVLLDFKILLDWPKFFPLLCLHNMIPKSDSLML